MASEKIGKFRPAKAVAAEEKGKATTTVSGRKPWVDMKAVLVAITPHLLRMAIEFAAGRKGKDGDQNAYNTAFAAAKAIWSPLPDGLRGSELGKAVGAFLTTTVVIAPLPEDPKEAEKAVDARKANLATASAVAKGLLLMEGRGREIRSLDLHVAALAEVFGGITTDDPGFRPLLRELKTLPATPSTRRAIAEGKFVPPTHPQTGDPLPVGPVIRTLYTHKGESFQRWQVLGGAGRESREALLPFLERRATTAAKTLAVAIRQEISEAQTRATERAMRDALADDDDAAHAPNKGKKAAVEKAIQEVIAGK